MAFNPQERVVAVPYLPQRLRDSFGRVEHVLEARLLASGGASGSSKAASVAAVSCLRHHRGRH